MTASPHPQDDRQAPDPARRILLLGLGNDILSDDAIGLLAAKAAGEILQGEDRITVALTSEMGLSLLDEIVSFDDLIIVDAVQTLKSPPGFVHELDGEDLSTLPAVSPHFLGVGEVLALGRKLGLAVPTRVKIFAVEAEDVTTVGTRLTAALQQVLPSVAQRIAAAAQAWTATPPQTSGCSTAS